MDRLAIIEHRESRLACSIALAGAAGEGAWSVLTNCRRRWLASSILLSHSLVGPQQILQNQGIDSKSEGRNGCMDAFLASKRRVVFSLAIDSIQCRQHQSMAPKPPFLRPKNAP